ncbi:MAG: hypothetical protein MK171_04360 [Pirellulales bacterium]|nr:hypothetical protein [Pirellulales bacterium]
MIQEMAKLIGAGNFFEAAPPGATDALVRQVVASSAAAVCERVAHEIETMSLPEARGYVRARAAQVVIRETRLAINDLSKADPVWLQAVARSATEQLVAVVLRQMRIGIPQLAAPRMAA